MSEYIKKTDLPMREIILKKRYPHSREEDITDAFMRGYMKGKADRPQGEWIDMGDFEQCSVCKGTRLKEFQSYYGKTTWVKTPYCPNCGSKMKGADDE